VFVGGTANVLYAALFLALSGQGDQLANVAWAMAPSTLADELHRRLTSAAGERVSWQTAQWEGGLLAVVGMLLSILALGWWQTVAGEGGPVAEFVTSFHTISR
jgi:hypothetical protein